MIFKKIQYSIAFIFMFGLLAVQSIVWVATQAADEPHDLLQAYFVQPTIGEVIPPDSYFDIQAMLSADTDSDFSTVHFNLSNPDKDIDLNFETFLADNSVWQSINYVDTSQLPGGIYYLSATAYIYDGDQLLDTWQSVPQLLDIAGGTEIAAPGNMANDGFVSFYEPNEGEIIRDYELSVKASASLAIPFLEFVLLDDNFQEINRMSGTHIDDPHNPDGQDYYSWLGYFNLAGLENGTYHVWVDIEGYMQDNPDIEIIVGEVSFVLDIIYHDLPPLEATFISPTTYEISGSTYVIVEFNYPLDDQSVELYIMTGDDVVDSMNMFAISDTQYRIELDTTAYDDGVYNLLVFVDNDDVGSKEIVINNFIEPEISLIEPVNNSVINNSSFQVEFETNFVPSFFSYELFNIDDPVISTGQIEIDSVGGQNWSDTINLNELFIDGQYILRTVASGGELENDLYENFYLELDLVEDEPLIPPEVPEDIFIELFNPGSNLSDLIDLQASANYPDLEIDFVVLNSTSQEEVLRLPATYFENIYIANFDTTLLANNNYYLLASTIFDDVEVASDSILVSIFNIGEGENDPICGDGEINQDSEECDDGNTEDGDGCSGNCILEEAPICGDGEINQDSEECDDGNTEDGDGCDADCILEEAQNNPPGNGGSDNQEEGDSVVIYDLDTTCLEAGILDETTCLHFLSLLHDTIDPICIEQNIYDSIACEDYLNIIYVDPQCQEVDIIDPEQCKDYLLEKYVSNVDCQLDDQNLCTSILRDEYLNRLVVESNNQQAIADVLDPLVGQNINLQDLSNQLEDHGLDQNILPLAPDIATQVLLADSQDEIVLEDREILTVLNSAVLIIDSDGDSLPDDLEEYYGTDIYNSDSDGDGYFDGEEIVNGYNPSGDGRLDIARTVFDEIILSKTPLKQPKIAPLNVDNTLTVKEIVNVDDKIRLNGQAEPNTWVNIYLYSDLPLVMTTKTDQDGNWSYTIQKSLQDEHHRVYVTVNSMTGKVVKQSAPTSFLVKSARAVTADDYFDTATTADTTDNMIFYYIAGAILLIIIGLVVILLLNRRRPDNLGV